MKKILFTVFRSLLCAGVILLMSASSYASHILGAELRYKWISGLTYQVTVYMYGDCGALGRAAFITLPSAKPQVCIYNGGVSDTTLTLNIDTSLCGIEVTPVCLDSLSYTTCTSLSYTIPGIKKFIYSTTYTFPSSQQYWRLIYNGGNGSSVDSITCNFDTGYVTPAASGRTASITNLLDPAGTIIQLIDTLNTTTSRGHNNSAVLTVEPMPFFCGYLWDCYNPGSNDFLDSSTFYGEPAGDSLVFSLIPPTNGTLACSSVGTACSYNPGMDAWTTPDTQVLDAAHPIQCVDGSTYLFDASNGQVCFEPVTQRATVVYNIDEYFHDTLTGTMQREMNFYVTTCDSAPCFGITLPLNTQPLPIVQKTEIYPNPANTVLMISSGEKISNITICNILGQTVYSQGCNAQKVQVDVADLPDGVYFVKINGTEVKKFLKE